MTHKPDNPPAFPITPETHEMGEYWQGMTLRDYFAAHAPITLADSYHAFMQKPDIGEPTKEQLMQDLAESRYAYATAMLKARDATHD
jgi:hypothetical protein